MHTTNSMAVPDTIAAIQTDTYAITNEHTLTVSYDRHCSREQPGNGGARWGQYFNHNDQVREAEILADHMSKKHALYATGFLGAKLVIDGPRDREHRTEVLRSAATILNQYDGAIFTGCDLNTTNEDLEFLATQTPYVLNSLTNTAIDTSQATGYGVFAAVRTILETDRSETVPHIAIHGLGRVGGRVAVEARAAGYRVTGYDLDGARPTDLGITGVEEAELFGNECSALILCSTTGIITNDVAASVRAKWIVSGTNSPLATIQAAVSLDERGVRYLPDIVANAGAVICDGIEYYRPKEFKSLTQRDIERYVCRRISGRTHQIVARADLLGISLTASTARDIGSQVLASTAQF
jgi:leucine dehydrogenase